MILKVIKTKKESGDSFSIIFEKPKKFSFYPGQYLDIALSTRHPEPDYVEVRQRRLDSGSKKKIPKPAESEARLRRQVRNDNNKDSRILSISSSPSEDFLMLTYKTGVSPYKQVLQKLKSGDIVESSHPAGTVVIDDSGPIVMLAGGIGIAPHRSMIKWVVDRKLDLPITLIYSNSDSDFTFKKEMNSWIKLYPKLNVHYTITGRDGRLDEEKLKSTLNSKFLILNSTFYLAGPPSMVDDFENILLKMGVDSVNIRTDRFDGY